MTLQFQIPPWISTLMSLNHFLHVLSASSPFVIVSATGSQFRQTIKLAFNKRNEINQPENGSNARNVQENIEMRTVTVSARYVSFSRHVTYV